MGEKRVGLNVAGAGTRRQGRGRASGGGGCCGDAGRVRTQTRFVHVRGPPGVALSAVTGASGFVLSELRDVPELREHHPCGEVVLSAVSLLRGLCWPSWIVITLAIIVFITLCIDE